jgi:hypothetical protein
MIIQVIPIIDLDVRSEVSEDKPRNPEVDITPSLIDGVDGETERNKLPNVDAEILQDLREHSKARNARRECVHVDSKN